MFFKDTKVGDVIQVFAGDNNDIYADNLYAKKIIRATVLEVGASRCMLGWKQGETKPSYTVTPALSYIEEGFVSCRTYGDHCVCLSLDEDYCFQDCCKKR